MTQGRQSHRQLVILVITLLSGLLGGLLGGIPWTVGLGSLAWTILAGTVLGTGVGFFLWTGERPDTGNRSPQTVRSPQTGRPASPHSTEPHAYSRPTFAQPPPSQTNRTRPVAPIGQRPEPDRQPAAEHPRIIPLTSGGASPSNGSTTRQWWDETSPAPSLSSYDAESALIAQCPRCGEFRLDVSQSAAAYAFRCRNANCGNTWTWTPGTPWPPVVVRRNLQGGSVAGMAAISERG